MARHLRVEFPGAIYHINIRGNARGVIFVDARDRERFLERLAESVETYNIRLYLFCMMTNHTHLVAETPDSNLSRFMQSILTGYAVYFNLRHDRVGHLTQGRYVAKLVEGDKYILSLSRYVHLNPVFTEASKKLPIKERIKVLRDYPWSSYRSYIGMGKELDFVKYGPMLAEMGGKKWQRRGKYREFVEAGLAETDEEFIEALKASPRSIGSDTFGAWVDDLYMKSVKKQGKAEDVAFRKMIKSLSTEDILKVVAEEFEVDRGEILRRQRDSFLRAAAAKVLCKYGGLTQRQVSEVIDLRTGSAVSHQIRKLNNQSARNRKLDRLMNRIQARLEQQQESQ